MTRGLSRARFALVATALGALACSRSDPTRTSPAPSTPPQPPSTDAPSTPAPVGSMRFTQRPLTDFCHDRPCAYDAYKSRVAKVQNCTRGEAGTCGIVRWIRLETMDGSETAYFDQKKQMLGAETSSDMAMGAVYGTAPHCNRIPSEHLCGVKRDQRSE